jgi:hypothetical protein
MLEEQSLLTRCKWEDVCEFDSGLSMVNDVMVEILQVAALRSYPFPHFRLHYDFSPRSYHSPTNTSSQFAQQIQRL